MWIRIRNTDHIYSEFRHTSKNFEGGLPKNILEKNTVYWKKGVEIWAFDGKFASIVGDPDVFGPPGSGSISHKYGSGSFPFLITVLSGLKEFLQNKILTQNVCKKLIFLDWKWCAFGQVIRKKYDTVRKKPLKLLNTVSYKIILSTVFSTVLRIHDIFGWIRIRGSMPLTNGSGSVSGSCYFRHWPSRCQQKTNFLTQFFLLITFWSYIYIIFQR